MVAGEFGALLAIETLPVALPAVVGANVTVNVVLAPALIDVGLKLIEYPDPLIDAAEIFSVALPLFVKVTVCVALLPTLTLLNATEAGLICSCAVPIVIVTASLPVPPAFVALTVIVDVPAALGLPEINPLVEFTFNPAGNPVAP
jgi:hypothetical protein